MKNVNRFLILCLALCVALSVAIFAADGEETIKIKNVAPEANVEENVLAENFEGKENFKLTYRDATDNGMYLLLVLSKPEDAGEDFDPAEDLKPEDGNILYVNQATADGKDVVFENVYPTEILEEDTYIFLAGADTGFILLGTIIPDVDDVMKGDVTGDGKVNLADYVAIRRWMVNKTTYPLKVPEAGDVTADDKTNLADAIAIRRWMVNKELYPFK